MKKIIFLLGLLALTPGAHAQCNTPPTEPFTGACGSLVSYIPSSGNVTIPVNFIFLQPLSGPGKFDTISKGTCDDIINFMNQKWGNLAPPMLPLPTPAPFYSDTRIRFSFKSIIFKPDAQYNAGPQYPVYDNADPYALNIVHNVRTGGPAGTACFGNVVRVIQDNAPGAFDLFDLGTRHLYYLHEVGHALGLLHTFDLSISNPNGTILPSPPVDDYWLEDGYISNNFMSYNWPYRDYLSPKQIGFMHYNLRTNIVMQKLLTATCPAFGADWTMTSNTYAGVIYADANLIIPQGEHVILSGCVYMKPGARIIVEPGGKLTVTGKITSACGDPWQGIEVQSNPGGVQYYDPITFMPSSSIGMLELNGAYIENAEIAVNVGKYNASGNYFIAGGVTYPGSYIQTTGGGLVFSENTKYVNNRIAVNFNPYFVWAANGADNLSYFKKDEFVINGQYVNANAAFAAVNINTTFRVDFLGCQFSDMEKMSAIGIRCFNGSVNVKDHCSSLAGGSCVGTLTQSKFEGFKYGVFMSNWIFNVPSTFRHVKFDQNFNFNGKPNGCLGGMYVLGSFGTEIVNCEFENVKLPGSAGPLSYGLYLDGCDGYVVENNSFRGLTNAYLSGGMFVNNSGPGANYIYNNTLRDHQQGLWTQNINYDPVTGVGLLINCNDFINDRYNLGVQSQYQGINCAGCPAIVQPGGIAPTQGVTTGGENKRVRNTYQVYSGIGNSCGNENKFYVDVPNSFVVTHGSFSGAQYHPTPQPGCSNASEVVDLVGAATANAKAVWCPSNYYQNFSKAALLGNLSTTRENISALATEMAAKLDGGNTGHLFDMFDQGVPPQALYDTLITKDFLSDTILKLFFAKNDITNAQIEALFTQNAPVHPSVWAQLSAMELDASLLASLSDLQFGQNALSPREQINSQLGLARTELGLLVNESVRRFLNDSTGPVFDSIAALYSLNEVPNAAFKLVDAAIATNHFDEAEDLISTLGADAANTDICTVLGHVKLLGEDPAYAQTMAADEDLYAYFKSKTGSTRPLLDTYVRTILAAVYDDRDDEVTLQPEGVDSNWEYDERKAEAGSTEQDLLNVPDGNKTIRVYPNPASNQLRVETDGVEEIRIEVTDVTGKVVIRQDCGNGCEVNVSLLSNGVYILNLYQHDKFIRASKLAVMK